MSILETNKQGEISLPALASAHSHAFQRSLRGMTQRHRELDEIESFWSWRLAMYSLAESLTPESIYSISRLAYKQLFANGVRTVGEFHYVHHQQNGIPYLQRTLLAEQVIQAALDEGLRISLLRVIYHRAGLGNSLHPTQLRFCDPNLETAFKDIEYLTQKYQKFKNVRIGVAPHSVRAVPPTWLEEIAQFSKTYSLPIHMHVNEQIREVDECFAETGLRPIELLDRKNVLSDRFVAVHATHANANEIKLLGEAKCFVCLCPTTERDLGDGLANISCMHANDVRICTGIDSHVITNPLEDLRSVDLFERLRTQKRVTLPKKERTPAEQLWQMGSVHGEIACGFHEPAERIEIDSKHPDLCGVHPSNYLDAIVYGVSSLNHSDRLSRKSSIEYNLGG